MKHVYGPPKAAPSRVLHLELLHDLDALHGFNPSWRRERYNSATVKTACAVLLLACLMVPAAAQENFPQADISSGRIRAKVYLPDPQAGYYRATRFDWSGVVASLAWNGHTFFGQWFQRHDPKIHDAITGPVEEFSSV